MSYKPIAVFSDAYCKPCWSILISSRYAKKRQAASRRRRALKTGARSEPYTSNEIADRDGWVCQICRRRIGRTLKWPHPRSLSIDHIVPLSKGGDDVRRNIQATHLGCNVSKFVNGIDQLRLIG